MAKIFRRKRRGREFGSFYVLKSGRPLCLQTQNATEANRRAKKVAAGMWPDASADVASRQARAVEHAEVAEPERDYQPTAAERATLSPAPAAAGISPEPEPSAPDVAAEVAAAASEAADAPVAPALEGDVAEEMGRELGKLLLGQGGSSDADVGEVLAAMLLGAEHAALSVWAAKKKKAIPEPQREGVLFRALASALKVWTSSALVNLNVHPAYVVAGALLAYPVQAVATATPVEESPAPEVR